MINTYSHTFGENCPVCSDSYTSGLCALVRIGSRVILPRPGVPQPTAPNPRISPPCDLCGNDLIWHRKHRPRHPFTLNSGADAGPLTDDELASIEAGLLEHPDEEDNARVLRLVAEVRRLRREVGTMRPYLDHKFACAVSREIRQGLGVESACSCGLAELRAS